MTTTRDDYRETDPTRLVRSWLTYEYWREAAEMILEAHGGETEPSLRELEQKLRDEIEEGSPLGVMPSGLYGDLLGYALAHVDWTEIARAFLEEAKDGCERWEVPLSIGAKTVLLHRMVADGVPVRFVNERGETVELVTGETFPRHVNVIHKPHYWSFDEETIRLIEERTGLKGIRAGDR